MASDLLAVSYYGRRVSVCVSACTSNSRSENAVERMLMSIREIKQKGKWQIKEENEEVKQVKE